MENFIKNVLEQSTVINNILFLPNIKLERDEYLQVKKKMEFLGGKWKTNKKGFVFDRDVTLEKILNSKEDKKTIQFFETPEEIADYLVELAEIDNYQTILEPSAGRGAIIKAIQKKCVCEIDYCEISEVNRDYLEEFSNIKFLGDDFLEIKNNKKYSRIIANPPFSKNQDIEHIKKMYDLLDDRGVLVSICSKHCEISSDKKCREFNKFLEYTKASIENIERGKFKDSGTMIGANIIKIIK